MAGNHHRPSTPDSGYSPVFTADDDALPSGNFMAGPHNDVPLMVGMAGAESGNSSGVMRVRWPADDDRDQYLDIGYLPIVKTGFSELVPHD